MILDEIVAYKQKEIERAKRICSLRRLKRQLVGLPPIRGFKEVLTQPGYNIIAEIKKASPSRGIIRALFDPVKIGQIYEKNGAKALSVLTDEHFFQGSWDYLMEVRKVTSLPLLCKEFIIDEYQIYKARLYGADGVLLIVTALTDHTLLKFLEICQSLGMEAIIEVHDREELKRILKVNIEIIGINNRDLKTFKVDLSTTFDLIKEIPEGKVIISESGIETKEDIRRLKEAGVNAFLVGEALMRERAIGKKLRELIDQ